MSYNYLIGLGGSGGKIISELYRRLIKENGEGFGKNVQCIAIDTDQDELSDLAELGVRKVCISDAGTVGQLYNQLGSDVGDWCPNTQNEGNFFSSPLFNGASQCRFKSRLSLANFLKNQNNSLRAALEESLIVSPINESSVDAPPRILIASSIAGGTGSGIFIQTALYVKKFFREYNISVQIVGLFACPDLYKGVVTAQQLPSLYANAYAVIRELNAFNIICGSETTAAYGGEIEVDIEISTECEGKLFEKDSKGRYGDKPYDIMYFIDKVNYLSKIIGGLPEYYKAMADIAYTHLYTDISGEVLSNESNELHAHNKVPGAIYGSAGAATVEYPYDDIVEYFAKRAVKESFGEEWTILDKEWENFCKSKDDVAKASGLTKYLPEEGERAQHYIDDFAKKTETSGLSQTPLSFLVPMTKRYDVPAVDAYMELVSSTVLSMVTEDTTLQSLKNRFGLADIEQISSNIAQAIEAATDDDRKDPDNVIFQTVDEVDGNLATYCEKAINYVYDLSITLANKMFCEDTELCGSYDRDEISVIKHILKNERGEWIHPVAARYLLYVLLSKLKDTSNGLFGDIDTPADDLSDYYNALVSTYVQTHVHSLDDDEDAPVKNVEIFRIMIRKLFGKRQARGQIEDYIASLEETVEGIEDTLYGALQYFAYIKVIKRIEALIGEYESFFDNIEEFNVKATVATASAEAKHDRSKGTVFVCASSEAKRALYEIAGKNINTKTGETASNISEAMFVVMRNKAIKNNGTKKAISSRERIQGIEEFFEKISKIVASNAKSNPEIQGSLDMNVFQAILREYALTYPENADDEANYNNKENESAKRRINDFFTSKLSGLVKMSAPFLIYDNNDIYNGMFETEVDGVLGPKPRVSNSYRYISHNSDVDFSICNMIGSESVQGFYDNRASDLPKDTESQTIKISYVKSDKIDPHRMICYSAVHCLQPYQISAFNELKDGVYYRHYSNRIIDMENEQKFSMSPHIDKRWHKPGIVPYINVSMEIARRHQLAKAFIFALCYGKIQYTAEGKDSKLIFEDGAINRPMEYIIYKGRFIPYDKMHRAMGWLADQEDLVERYSVLFDKAIEDEVEMMSAKYGETVEGYKGGITTNARILKQLRDKVIRPKDIVSKKQKSGDEDAETKKAKKDKEKKEKDKNKKDDINLLTLAWRLHISEENELDKDYGELLVSMLWETIKRYAKAPYNAKAIERKDEGSDAYRNYLDVRKHLMSKFLELHAKAVYKKIVGAKKAEAAAEKAKNKGKTAKKTTARKFPERKPQEDIVEETVKIDTSKFGFDVNGDVASDQGFVWANGQLTNFFDEK